MKRYFILLIFLPIYLFGQQSEPQTAWEYFPSQSQAFLFIEELLIDNQPVAGIGITDGCDLPESSTTAYLYLTEDGSVLYKSPYDLGGFQFNVDNTTLWGVGGGVADEELGYQINWSPDNSMVLAFSLTGGFIESGCGTLLELILSEPATGLSNIVTVGQLGNVMDNEYFTCQMYGSCDILGAFIDRDGEEICIGWAFAYSGLIDLMGQSDSDPNTDAYLQNGEIPYLKLYDSNNATILDGDPSENLHGFSNYDYYSISQLLAYNYSGCSDSTACNYNPNAMYDDGSCQYPTESYDCDNNCVGELINDFCYSLSDLNALVDFAENSDLPTEFENVLEMGNQTWNVEGKLEYWSCRNFVLLGTIPSSIGNLTGLTYLNFHSNGFTGSIPPQIGNLTNLGHLSIEGCGLSGTIPPEIGNLTNLEHLYLQNNALTGTIPPEIGNLTELIGLALYKNDLSGAVPPEIGNLTNLEWLNLQNNALTGTIPPEIGNLTELTSLNLDYNDLSGPIPPQIGNLSALTQLNLSVNEFTTIPIEIGNLAGLQALALDANNFSGTIPIQIGSLTALYYLNLSENSFSGTIPVWIGNLIELELLALDDNNLSGSIPPEIGSLTNLEHLYLQNNALTGAIPDVFCLFNVIYADFGNNNLCPPYPECLSNDDIGDQNMEECTMLIDMEIQNVDIDNGLLDVHISSTVPLLGYQFELPGIRIMNAFGGLSADYNYIISTSGTSVMSFSMYSTEIPPSDSLLIQVNFFDYADSTICFGTDIIKNVISDPSGYAIELVNWGQCYIPPVYGCMDENACNYNESATEDDGSCIYPEENSYCEGNCFDGYALDNCGNCSEPDIIGCGCDLPDLNIYLTEDGTVLYNSSEAIAGFQFDVVGATVENASGGIADSSDYVFSIYESTVLGFSMTGMTIPAGCGILVELDLSNVAISLEDIIVADASGFQLEEFSYYFIGGGCADPTACNYDSSATIDDGSCAYDFDCSGICGGAAAYDICGVCDGDNDCFTYPDEQVEHWYFIEEKLYSDTDCSEIIDCSDFSSLSSLCNSTIGCEWNGEECFQPVTIDDLPRELVFYPDGTFMFTFYHNEFTCSSDDDCAAEFDGADNIDSFWCDHLSSFCHYQLSGEWGSTIDQVCITGYGWTASDEWLCLPINYLGDGQWTLQEIGSESCSEYVYANSLSGCTDPGACNYNPVATEEDGSCMFNDCNDECGGSAFLDDCGDCVGGTTDLAPNMTMDECGVCNGPGGSIVCWDGSNACSTSECPLDPDECPDGTVWIEIQPNLCIPDSFLVKQSTLQSIYFFVSVMIDSVDIDPDDWVGAFNDSTCVGSQRWDTTGSCSNAIDANQTNCELAGDVWTWNQCNGGMCDLALMGDNGLETTAGYMENGNIPTYKIYDASENVYYDAIPSENIPWTDMGMPIIDNLNGFVFIPGCTDPLAGNYNEDANVDDGNCCLDNDVGVAPFTCAQAVANFGCDQNWGGA